MSLSEVGRARTSPRGRSLVFALVSQPPGAKGPRCKAEGEPWTEAEQAHDDRTTAALSAAHRLDQQRGVGASMYGPGVKEEKRQRVRPEDVAEKLRLIEPRTPTQSELQHAMAEMIVGAMYWQPLHSADVLCMDPAMMDALHPWARTLIDSRLLDSWSTTLDLAEQWAECGSTQRFHDGDR